MIRILLIVASLLFLSFIGAPKENCASEGALQERGPQRLVLITGKATLEGLPEGPLPATSHPLIFQKVDCPSCYVGAQVEADGSYKILVGDGKYKVIVRSPSIPEVDLLAPGQVNIVDTGSENSPNSVIKFDIRIKYPK
jgi:hypothetical protein